MKTLQERTEHIVSLLETFSEQNGENPIEYQNDIVPNVTKTLEWLVAKDIITQKESDLFSDSVDEPFQFYYTSENPYTLEKDDRFAYKTFALMISENLDSYKLFVDKFSLN